MLFFALINPFKVKAQIVKEYVYLESENNESKETDCECGC